MSSANSNHVVQVPVCLVDQAVIATYDPMSVTAYVVP